MKIRNDFVSNSSSSSFIVAVNADYKIKDFAKDLGKACVDKKSSYHDPELADKNRTVLEFCLNTYELLFLGTLNLGKREYVTTLEKVKAEWAANSELDGALANDVILNGISDEWNRHKSSAERKDKWADPFNWYDAETDETHEFYDLTAALIAVPSEDMWYLFNRYMSAKDSKYAKANRVDSIVKYAKAVAENPDFQNSIHCFQITENTIKNTKDLLEFKDKADLTVDKSLVKKIDTSLKKGNRVFSIRIGHDGEGYGNFYVYCEDGAKGLDRLVVQLLGSFD